VTRDWFTSASDAAQKEVNLSLRTKLGSRATFYCLHPITSPDCKRTLGASNLQVFLKSLALEWTFRNFLNLWHLVGHHTLAYSNNCLAPGTP
jgi:hypothetical protein